MKKKKAMKKPKDLIKYYCYSNYFFAMFLKRQHTQPGYSCF